MTDPLTISLSEETRHALASRADPPEALPIERDLRRYYEALRHARATLRTVFKANEVALILDVLNGPRLDDPYHVAWITAEIEDGIRLNRLDEKWQVNGAALLDILAGLSYVEKCALADAAERWWTRVSRGEHELAPGEALAD